MTILQPGTATALSMDFFPRESSLTSDLPGPLVNSSPCPSPFSIYRLQSNKVPRCPPIAFRFGIRSTDLDTYQQDETIFTLEFEGVRGGSDPLLATDTAGRLISPGLSSGVGANLGSPALDNTSWHWLPIPQRALCMQGHQGK